MKFEKFAPLLIVVLVLAAALMLAQGFGLFKRKTVAVDPTQVELQRVIKEDKENLAKPAADENSIAGALERLSMRTDPDVKEFIKKYWEHPSPLVRAAAVEAAGSFQNEEAFTTMIRDGLKSDNEIVRTGALRALARQGGVENESLLITHIKRPKMSEEERYHLYLALLKVATQSDIKRESMKRLIAMSEAGDGTRLIDVFLYAPDDSILIEKAKEILKAKKNIDLMARSIQYLMTYDKDWMKENLIQMEVVDDARFQLVLLDALRVLCPAGRPELLEKIKASAKNADVQKGVENFSCQ